MRKKIIIIYLLMSLMMTAQQAIAAADVQALDQIVAVINDDVITKTELNQAFQIVKIQMQQQGMKLANEHKLKQDVLEQLINKKLELQIAKQAGVNTSNRDIDQAVSNIAKQNNMSVNEFYQRLAAEGMSKDTYIAEMRDQLTIQKLQQQQIISHIVITPDEVKEFNKSTRKSATVSKTYHLQDILVPFSDDPSKTEIAKAKQLAQTIINKLKQGEAVRTAIKTEGKGKVKLKDMGTLEKSDLPSAFSNVVTSMQKKEVSKPIQTGNGIHIVRVVDINSKTIPAVAASSREIQNQLGQKKFEEELQVWLAKLRSQAYIVNKLNE